MIIYDCSRHPGHKWSSEYPCLCCVAGIPSQKKGKPKLVWVERYADNGELTHYEKVNTETGEVVDTSIKED